MNITLFEANFILRLEGADGAEVELDELLGDSTNSGWMVLTSNKNMLHNWLA